MFRSFSLALLGAATVGLTLATPNVGRAQSPFGIHLDVGRVHFDFNTGSRHVHAPVHHQYGRPAPVVVNYGYPSYLPRTVVVPQYYAPYPANYGAYNYDAYRYGPVVIPHRDHCHVRPY